MGGGRHRPGPRGVTPPAPPRPPPRPPPPPETPACPRSLSRRNRLARTSRSSLQIDHRLLSAHPAIRTVHLHPTAELRPPRLIRVVQLPARHAHRTGLSRTGPGCLAPHQHRINPHPRTLPRTPRHHPP